MSKAIRELVEKANRAMQKGTLRDNDKLFYFISNILTEKKMYKGFNLYCWDTLGNGEKWLKLAGGDPKHTDKEGRFVELPTDVRQFYIY
jgi:hypothetical protein